jgi:hypothetical protein
MRRTMSASYQYWVARGALWTDSKDKYAVLGKGFDRTGVGVQSGLDVAANFEGRAMPAERILCILASEGSLMRSLT